MEVGEEDAIMDELVLAHLRIMGYWNAVNGFVQDSEHVTSTTMVRSKFRHMQLGTVVHEYLEIKAKVDDAVQTFKNEIDVLTSDGLSRRVTELLKLLLVYKSLKQGRATPKPSTSSSEPRIRMIQVKNDVSRQADIIGVDSRKQTIVQVQGGPGKPGVSGISAASTAQQQPTTSVQPPPPMQPQYVFNIVPVVPETPGKEPKPTLVPATPGSSGQGCKRRKPERVVKRSSPVGTPDEMARKACELLLSNESEQAKLAENLANSINSVIHLGIPMDQLKATGHQADDSGCGSSSSSASGSGSHLLPESPQKEQLLDAIAEKALDPLESILEEVFGNDWNSASPRKGTKDPNKHTPSQKPSADEPSLQSPPEVAERMLMPPPASPLTPLDKTNVVFSPSRTRVLRNNAERMATNVKAASAALPDVTPKIQAHLRSDKSIFSPVTPLAETPSTPAQVDSKATPAGKNELTTTVPSYVFLPTYSYTLVTQPTGFPASGPAVIGTPSMQAQLGAQKVTEVKSSTKQILPRVNAPPGRKSGALLGLFKAQMQTIKPSSEKKKPQAESEAESQSAGTSTGEAAQSEKKEEKARDEASGTVPEPQPEQTKPVSAPAPVPAPVPVPALPKPSPTPAPSFQPRPGTRRSLSTPRRDTSHVRLLDFSSPRSLKASLMGRNNLGGCTPTTESDEEGKWDRRKMKEAVNAAKTGLVFPSPAYGKEDDEIDVVTIDDDEDQPVKPAQSISTVEESDEPFPTVDACVATEGDPASIGCSNLSCLTSDQVDVAPYKFNGIECRDSAAQTTVHYHERPRPYNGVVFMSNMDKRFQPNLETAAATDNLDSPMKSSSSQPLFNPDIPVDLATPFKPGCSSSSSFGLYNFSPIATPDIAAVKNMSESTDDLFNALNCYPNGILRAAGIVPGNDIKVSQVGTVPITPGAEWKAPFSPPSNSLSSVKEIEDLKRLPSQEPGDSPGEAPCTSALIHITEEPTGRRRSSRTNARKIPVEEKVEKIKVSRKKKEIPVIPEMPVEFTEPLAPSSKHRQILPRIQIPPGVQIPPVAEQVVAPLPTHVSQVDILPEKSGRKPRTKKDKDIPETVPSPVEEKPKGRGSRSRQRPSNDQAAVSIGEESGDAAGTKRRSSKSNERPVASPVRRSPRSPRKKSADAGAKRQSSRSNERHDSPVRQSKRSPKNESADAAAKRRSSKSNERPAEAPVHQSRRRSSKSSDGSRDIAVEEPKKEPEKVPEKGKPGRKPRKKKDEAEDVLGTPEVPSVQESHVESKIEDVPKKRGRKPKAPAGVEGDKPEIVEKGRTASKDRAASGKSDEKDVKKDLEDIPKTDNAKAKEKSSKKDEAETGVPKEPVPSTSNANLTSEKPSSVDPAPETSKEAKLTKKKEKEVKSHEVKPKENSTVPKTSEKPPEEKLGSKKEDKSHEKRGKAPDAPKMSVNDNARFLAKLPSGLEVTVKPAKSPEVPDTSYPSSSKSEKHSKLEISKVVKEKATSEKDRKPHVEAAKSQPPQVEKDRSTKTLDPRKPQVEPIKSQQPLPVSNGPSSSDKPKPTMKEVLANASKLLPSTSCKDATKPNVEESLPVQTNKNIPTSHPQVQSQVAKPPPVRVDPRTIPGSSGAGLRRSCRNALLPPPRTHPTARPMTDASHVTQLGFSVQTLLEDSATTPFHWSNSGSNSAGNQREIRGIGDLINDPRAERHAVGINLSEDSSDEEGTPGKRRRKAGWGEQFGSPRKRKAAGKEIEMNSPPSKPGQKRRLDSPGRKNPAKKPHLAADKRRQACVEIFGSDVDTMDEATPMKPAPPQSPPPTMDASLSSFPKEVRRIQPIYLGPPQLPKKLTPTTTPKKPVANKTPSKQPPAGVEEHEETPSPSSSSTTNSSTTLTSRSPAPEEGEVESSSSSDDSSSSSSSSSSDSDSGPFCTKSDCSQAVDDGRLCDESRCQRKCHKVPTPARVDFAGILSDGDANVGEKRNDSAPAVPVPVPELPCVPIPAPEPPCVPAPVAVAEIQRKEPEQPAEEPQLPPIPDDLSDDEFTALIQSRLREVTFDLFSFNLPTAEEGEKNSDSREDGEILSDTESSQKILPGTEEKSRKEIQLQGESSKKVEKPAGDEKQKDLKRVPSKSDEKPNDSSEGIKDSEIGSRNLNKEPNSETRVDSRNPERSAAKDGGEHRRSSTERVHRRGEAEEKRSHKERGSSSLEREKHAEKRNGSSDRENEVRRDPEHRESPSEEERERHPPGRRHHQQHHQHREPEREWEHEGRGALSGRLYAAELRRAGVPVGFSAGGGSHDYGRGSRGGEHARRTSPLREYARGPSFRDLGRHRNERRGNERRYSPTRHPRSRR